MALIPCGRKKQSKSDGHLQSNNLCDELQTEILLRLPSKSLVRFKVVCKHWYSLISSPYLVSRQYSDDDVQSSLVLQTRYCCDDRNCKCQRYHCDIPNYSEFQIISHSSLLRNVYGGGFSLNFLPCSTRLEGSFDDLILSSSITKRVSPNPDEINYYVSNLLTRQWVALPSARVYEFFPDGVSVCFLCFESKHKFVVVRLHSDQYIKPLPRFQFKVQVFCSEHGQWKTLVVSSHVTLQPLDLMSPLVVFRGMLHCLFANDIAVYDPFNTPETFSRIIRLPTQLCYYNCCFGVCQGRLRVVASRKSLVVYVWELENYDSGLWNLVHKAYIEDLPYNCFRIAKERLESKLYPFTLHPKSGNKVYLRMGNRIALVNMKTRLIKCYYPITKNAVFCGVNVVHLAFL